MIDRRHDLAGWTQSGSTAKTALRRRRAWRQADLAKAARASRSRISRLELGHADEMTVAGLESVARALGARLNMTLSWNGEALDRLLDADHAELVEIVAATLRALAWDMAIEVSFNIDCERGSIDVLAFHPRTGTVLVVEVKSVVPDIQATVFTLDRKSRLALVIARQRGWNGRAVGRLLAVRESRTSRRRVIEHAMTFDAAFPARTVEVKRWLRRPDGTPGFSGLFFLANDPAVSTPHRVAGPPSPSRA